MTTTMRLVPVAPLLVAALLSACSPAVARPAPHAARTTAARSHRPALSPARLLARAESEYDASDYAKAEADFRAAARGSQRGPALVGLGHALLETGRYAEAIRVAHQAARAGKKSVPGAAWLEAEALRRQGRLAPAIAVLSKVENLPEARRARLLLGEILIEQGKRSDAQAPLMTLVDDYNNNRIPQTDATGLAMVGRAAELLRSPNDANDAFNQAEQARRGDIQTLLWRAELFLDKYDPGHAEEVTQEVLKKAPNQPEAHVWMAKVKLDQSLDFDAATREAKKALAVNPKLGGAYFVLAGIALRDMELKQADRELDAGLKYNPNDLQLLSMKAAVRFLADDAAGFEQAKQAVLSRNPEYARMYQIVAEYADWQHRYDAIVKMMREAVRIDPDDAKAYADLGLNLIRDGDDKDGVAALRTAFNKDPFNVRVYNTLNLYEKVIPRDYVTVKHKLFRMRYRKDEAPILDRYVPELLDMAWKKYVKEYGFTPSTPVGVELYAQRQNFAIRTSGLPETAIQGVCFGKTIAAMSPKTESFNLGMTLWHELSHVFHIQLSKSHVPRWFTEGLAEYETLSERPEWKREQDLELYEALRDDRLPKLGNMNRAFTHAEQLSDVALAYYASTQIMVMLVQHYGMPKMAEMMRLWGQGKRTPEVMQTALGKTPGELDEEFKAFERVKLARYATQFIPISHAPPLEDAKAAAAKAPDDARTQTLYALAAAGAGDADAAAQALAEALKDDPKFPDAIWLEIQLAAAKNDAPKAETLLHQLIQAGHDGYPVEMELARVLEAEHKAAGLETALEAATRFDPSQGDPLERLAVMAKQQGDQRAEIDDLQKLALIEQHNPDVYRPLLRLLINEKHYADAVRIGNMGIWADLEGLEMHELFGEALIGAKMIPRAIYELNTAVLCQGDAKSKAHAYAELARAYLEVPNRGAARHAAQKARELDPSDPLVKTLRL
jgi:tetratricopeptide (TPR) repeat protein